MKADQVKIGACIRIKADEHNGYYGGTRYRITRIDRSDNTLKAERADVRGTEGGWLRNSQVELYEMTKDEILKDISDAQASIENSHSMLAWMEDNGSDVFNEDEFKVWQVLTAMEDENISKIDKVKRIAQMIKG
jgi:hypothetical protein